MNSQFDASEFIDDDLHPTPKSGYGYAPGTGVATATGGTAGAGPGGGGMSMGSGLSGGLGTSLSGVGSGIGSGSGITGGSMTGKAPSREEVELQMSEMQRRLADLRNEQQRLEQERTALEETRRRQAEFTTGRQEMIQNLTRAVALVEEAEFSHRREAEQRAKSLVDLREALSKIQSISQETWTKDNFEIELTRALTSLDNARMEWNSSRTKFSELSDNPQSAGGVDTRGPADSQRLPAAFPQSFAELCKLGFAINWPLFLLGMGIFVLLWFRR